MENKIMKTLTVGSTTYEIVDEEARNSASVLKEATTSDVGKFLRINAEGKAEWQTVPSAEGVSF